jgi:hypothetical protein
MCALEEFDAPCGYDCPASDFYSLFCDNGDDIEVKTMIEGFEVIRPCDVGYVAQKGLAFS